MKACIQLIQEISQFIKLQTSGGLEWVVMRLNEMGRDKKRAMKALNTGMLTKNHYWIGTNTQRYSPGSKYKSILI